MLVVKKSNYLSLLFISVFLILFGRTLELLIWEAPFRVFFWDEKWLKPMIEGVFYTDWTTYTKSLTVDRWIQRFNDLCGILLLLASISTIFLYLNYTQRIFKILILLGTTIVGIILMLEYKDKFYHFAQFLEGFTQFFTPIILLMFISKHINTQQLAFWLKVVIAFTFLGHGLYAINIYATPGYFIDMIIVILGTTEDFAKQLLWVVGWIDIFLMILLFIPSTTKAALYYATIWGLLTALARFVYFLKLNNFDYHSLNIIHTTLFRLPHGLVPLAILFILNYRKKHIPYESI